MILYALRSKLDGTYRTDGYGDLWVTEYRERAVFEATSWEYAVKVAVVDEHNTEEVHCGEA